MSAPASMVVVGAGLNGLVAACLLARSGARVVVLERRASVGGCLVTGEIAPGFRGPVLSHVAGPLLPAVARSLELHGAGVAPAGPQGRLCALDPEGGALLIEGDRTVRPVGRALSQSDAQRFTEFTDIVRALGSVLLPLLTSAPPSIDSPGLSDLLALLDRGRRFRALGRRNAFRLLQWAPMPVADVASDWFDDPLLRAVVAARGIFGRHAGPRSGGTMLELLMHAALSGHVVAHSTLPAGGPGALTQALERAARDTGVEIRTNAAVSEIVVERGRVRGVRLAGGGTLPADVVVSGAGPRRTLLDLVDAGELGPELVGHVRRFRSDGVVAKINLALSALPRVTGVESLSDAEREGALAGRVHIGPTLDYLEQAFDCAKYGEYSPRPYLDIRVPTLADRELAPPGRHVMSIVLQFAPRYLRGGSWADARAGLANAALDTLETYAPGIRALVVASEVITPEDLEQVYGLAGGHIFHGEHALDQLFFMRPVYGWAHYRTPVAGLYLCGAGTHPGGGVYGVPGRLAAEAVLADRRRSGG